jgi:UDP-2,3-diacylglucosamine pyrophosphatase LpxH
MPISVKADIKPLYKFGRDFSLRGTPGFVRDTPEVAGRSYLNFVRNAAADQSFDRFHSSWGVLAGPEKDVNRALAMKFNLRQGDLPTYDELWKIVSKAHDFKKKSSTETAILADLDAAYGLAAKLANGGSLTGNPKTWSRVTERTDANFVVFSDFHMTDFTSISLPNYFKDFNLPLYLSVLRHYRALGDFTVVENGDVEECVIYEPTLADSKARQKAFKALPVVASDPKWDDFLDLRYAARLDALNTVIAGFGDYYVLIKNEFIARDRYVRLTGNHDTYLPEARERDLLNRIEGHLGVPVFDVMRVNRSGSPGYLVMHGHQFDTVSIQHGTTAFAKSLGEVFSETSSWIYQGPDRFWTSSDTNRWINGANFGNFLARETSGEFDGDAAWHLLFGSKPKIRSDAADFVEQLLGHEIAWEYFENDDPFNAFALEVITGEEMFKFRHLNERELCSEYANKFMGLQQQPFSKPIPKLVLGHTHEPRQNSVNPSSGTEAYWYLNSGAAGRFENLIWCVEVTGSEDAIVSWSMVDGKLRKITWEPVHEEQTLQIPTGGSITSHQSSFRHLRVEHFTAQT